MEKSKLPTNKDLCNFYICKEEHYENTDRFIKKYQQTNASKKSYLAFAIESGHMIYKSLAEPNQKWHFIESWYKSKIMTVDNFDEKRAIKWCGLRCPELLIWMAEAAGVEVSDVVCDKCGAMMVYKMGRFGKFLACPNFPECRNTKAIVEKINVPCPKCGAALIKRKTKRGKVFYGCEKYPECDFVSWDMPSGENCPKCGAIMVNKVGPRGKYVACSNKDCGYIERSAKKGTENDDEK